MAGGPRVTQSHWVLVSVNRALPSVRAAVGGEASECTAGVGTAPGGGGPGRRCGARVQGCATLPPRLWDAPGVSQGKPVPDKGCCAQNNSWHLCNAQFVKTSFTSVRSPRDAPNCPAAGGQSAGASSSVESRGGSQDSTLAGPGVRTCASWAGQPEDTLLQAAAGSGQHKASGLSFKALMESRLHTHMQGASASEPEPTDAAAPAVLSPKLLHHKDALGVLSLRMFSFLGRHNPQREAAAGGSERSVRDEDRGARGAWASEPTQAEAGARQGSGRPLSLFWVDSSTCTAVPPLPPVGAKLRRQHSVPPACSRLLDGAQLCQARQARHPARTRAQGQRFLTPSGSRSRWLHTWRRGVHSEQRKGPCKDGDVPNSATCGPIRLLMLT